MTFKGALRVARIVLEDAIVPKVNVVVVNVLVLQQIENVIQMFVGIVGSGEFIISFQSFVEMLFTIGMIRDYVCEHDKLMNVCANLFNRLFSCFLWTVHMVRIKQISKIFRKSRICYIPHFCHCMFLIC